MKKKPTKRTNWKQKYEDVNKAFNDILNDHAEVLKENAQLKADLCLERDLHALDNRDANEAAAKYRAIEAAQARNLRIRHHTLTILTQTGIATKEQCEIARRLAETIVKDNTQKTTGTPLTDAYPDGIFYSPLDAIVKDAMPKQQDENPSRLKSALTGGLTAFAELKLPRREDWMAGLGGAVAGSKAYEIYPTDRHIVFEPKKEDEVPKQEGFKGLPYQVVPSGNWKGLDRSAYPSVKAPVTSFTPTQIADIDKDIKDAMIEADKQLSNMIREIPTHPFEKKEGE